MKPYLIYLIILLNPLISFGQQKQAPELSKPSDIKVIKNFIQDLANEEIALDVILSKYVVIEDGTDELYDYLDVSLQEIRLNLMSKNINQIQYKNYRELPKKEVRDIDPEDLALENMYFLYHKDRLVTSIYVENNKIYSFTLVSKGENMAHFVLY